MRNHWILVMALVLFVPAAWAQQATANWDNLKQIERGKRVRVVETNLKSTMGKFQSFSDTELVLEVNNAPVVIPREKVFRVNEDHRRGRNALIAGLVGAGIGAGAGAAAAGQFNKGGDKAAVVVAGMGVWGGIFSGVAALVTRNPTVYRAEAPKPAAKENTGSFDSRVQKQRALAQDDNAW